MRRLILVLLAVMCMAPLCGAQTSKEGFLDFDIHAMVGGSYVTENYMSCFSEISDLNTNMGVQVGVGAGARFQLKSWLRLGTELNFTRSTGSLDMAVTGHNAASISNVFQRNTYYAFDIPIYISWTPMLANGVMWNLDGGLYYSYGSGGKQVNSIYDAKTNDLGQLMTTHTKLESGYYGSEGFLIGMKRADIGLHVATGLTFASHFRIGVRAHIGLKNVSKSTGLVNPSCHNISFAGTIGWQF